MAVEIVRVSGAARIVTKRRVFVQKLPPSNVIARSRVDHNLGPRVVGRATIPAVIPTIRFRKLQPEIRRQLTLVVAAARAQRAA